MTSAPGAAGPGDLAERYREVTVALLAAWMGERYFRTFRRDPGDTEGATAPSAFDAVLLQRDRRVGVTVGLLWDGEPPPGADDLASLLRHELPDDERDRSLAVWVPPGATLPTDEPRASELRVLLGNALTGLEPAQRREARIPVTLGLAKVDDDGAYMSVSGGLASEWTTLSEGISGAFHLDARELHRLSEERAELDIAISRIRDYAAAMSLHDATPVEVHDYWLVSRIPGDEPAGVTIVGAPPSFDPLEGAVVRRMLRQNLRRAGEQRAAAEAAGEPVDLTAVALLTPLAHLGDEMATAALRGMSPAAYTGIDLITLGADGSMRQVLQPRSLPWETAGP